MTSDDLIRPPTADMLRTIRERHGYTQAQCGYIVGASERKWQRWEAGDAGMPLSAWWLWLLRIAEITPAMLPEIPPRMRAGAMIHVRRSA